MNTKHTQGPVTVKPGIGCGDLYRIVADEPETGNGTFATVLHAPSKLHPIAVAQANAYLIAEAFNVAEETGLTPRQLADQRRELREVCKEALIAADYYDKREGSLIPDKIRAILAKTEAP